jgi:hypothetical protein
MRASSLRAVLLERKKAAGYLGRGDPRGKLTELEWELIRARRARGIAKNAHADDLLALFPSRGPWSEQDQQDFAVVAMRALRLLFPHIAVTMLMLVERWQPSYAPLAFDALELRRSAEVDPSLRDRLRSLAGEPPPGRAFVECSRDDEDEDTDEDTDEDEDG